MTVTLLAHLAELDKRRLYLAEGCSSLFSWCTEVLHYSEAAAYNRIKCARAIRRFPLVLERLADGSVHLTAVRLLAPCLTEANHREVLDRARHLGRRAVEELVAELRPRPDAASVIRRVAESTSVAPGATLLLELGPAPARQAAQVPHSSSRGVEAAVPRTGSASVASAPAATTPLSPGRYRFQFTADHEMHDDFLQARELLRHQFPGGDAAAIMKLALRRLVADLRKRKFAQMDRPKPANGRPVGPTTTTGRHIPSAVRRHVAERDGARCTFVSQSGRRCSETGQLEFHHHEPFALGGAATIENISLRCRAHNAHEARETYGSKAALKHRRGAGEVREIGPGYRTTPTTGTFRAGPGPKAPDLPVPHRLVPGPVGNRKARPDRPGEARRSPSARLPP
ncbi:MAG TPA: hypothetical protein VF720_08850 [Candidatus Eisenbacteria bacterium]